MLDIKYIRANLEEAKSRLKKRGSDFADQLELIVDQDNQRRKALQESEHLKNRKKTLSADVGKLKSEGKNADELIGSVLILNNEIKTIDEVLRVKDEEIRKEILNIPNFPDETVPEGKDESQNQFIRDCGEKPQFNFKPKNHIELGEKTDVLDLKRAAKISGARFAVFKGQGAKLLRALVNFMLDVQTQENGYQEIYPPVLVNEDCLTGTGQLPKFAEDLFKLGDDPYYLIPTAEAPLTNLHRDEVLNEKQLPIKYTASTLCFRREAGSYGKDTQGIIRQHQFDKVELVKFVKPENAQEELEALLANAESILQKLNLHYRVVNLCSGDLGFSAAKTFDIEVWLPSQDTYREISSCSTFTDYQARRAKIRFKKGDGSGTEFVHTLNGSGLAAGRLFVAVLENCQQEDGTIKIPEALIPYMGGKNIIGGK
jgi:seryl-tRNA synthetase